MLEIALFGLVVVMIYFIAHHATMRIEAGCGKPMGAWRSAVFFTIFLVLMLIAIQVQRLLTG